LTLAIALGGETTSPEAPGSTIVSALELGGEALLGPANPAACTGRLIHTVVGTAFGCARPFGNRSGFFVNASASTRALFALRCGESKVDVVRREQPDSDVVMLGVVPGEEVAAEAACVLERTESVRKVGPVLQGLELRFGEWVVVRDVWPRVPNR
jgi:hypothetical protein